MKIQNILLFLSISLMSCTSSSLEVFERYNIDMPLNVSQDTMGDTYQKLLKELSPQQREEMAKLMIKSHESYQQHQKKNSQIGVDEFYVMKYILPNVEKNNPYYAKWIKRLDNDASELWFLHFIINEWITKYPHDPHAWEVLYDAAHTQEMELPFHYSIIIMLDEKKLMDTPEGKKIIKIGYEIFPKEHWENSVRKNGI